MFLGFANFYHRFIQGLSQIAAPLTSMLKTSGSIESKTRLGEGRVRVDDSSRAEHGGDWSKIDDNEVDGNEIEDNEVEKKVQKLSKSKNLSKSKKTVGSDFFTPKAKLAFTKLRQVFVKALILHHFNLECQIWIETNISGYAICGVFNQLTSDNLSRWHLVAFISWKMIPAETRYETHDSEFLAIVKVFKT